MPIYPYLCGSCGHHQDVLQKMSAAPLTTCPECNAETFSKQLSAPAFQLKGSGWYVTDFRENGKKPEGGEKGAEKGGEKAADGAAAATPAPATDAATPAAAGATSPAPAPAASPAPAPAPAATSANTSSTASASK